MQKSNWKISIWFIIVICLLIYFSKIIIIENKNILSTSDGESYREEKEDNEKLCTFEGQWNLTDTHTSITATIMITEQDDKGFHFVIDAGYFMHSDTIEGDARFISPKTAEYIVEDDSESRIKFILSDNILNVEKKGCPISPGVDIEGKYILGDPVYVNSDVLTTTYTEAELTSIKNLLPEYKYEDYFIFCSKNGLCDEDEVTLSDDIKARYIYVYVPTAGMGYNAIITEKGAIYIKLFNKDQSFYTNDTGWSSNELPVIKESDNARI